MKQASISEEVRQNLKQIENELIWICSCTNMHKCLFEELEKGEKYKRVAKKTSFVFMVLDQSLQNNTLIGLAKICDEQNQSIGIKAIIDMIKEQAESDSEYHLIQERISRATNLYEETKDVRKKLKKLRNKNLAHNDKKSSNNLEKLYEDNKINFGDVFQLINKLYNILHIFLDDNGNEYENKECKYRCEYVEVRALLEYAARGM